MATYQELLVQREALDKQIEEMQLTEANTAIAHVRQLIADCQLSTEYGVFKSASASGAKKAKSAVAAKYLGPNGETWSRCALTWQGAREAQARQWAEFSIF